MSLCLCVVCVVAMWLCGVFVMYCAVWYGLSFAFVCLCVCFECGLWCDVVCVLFVSLCVCLCVCGLCLKCLCGVFVDYCVMLYELCLCFHRSKHATARVVVLVSDCCVLVLVCVFG